MDVLDGIPKRVLGYGIQTRTTIVFAFLIPSSLELIAYMIQTLADVAVTIQLFRDQEPLYGWLTLTLVLLPPFLTFIIVITSSWQWPEAKGCHSENVQFFFKQVFNLFCFPIGAIIRFCRRIFWSVEALFHDENTQQRQHSMLKAAETSPFELYRFVQAYVQAAPQVILQLFILLRNDIFRNYETTNVQVLSVIFSLVNIAVITMSYQRFESQKVVGRHYPWSTNEYVQHRRRRFQRTRSLTDELIKSKKRATQISGTFSESEHIMKNFYSQHSQQQPRALSEPAYPSHRQSRVNASEPRPGPSTQYGNLNASQNVAGKKTDNTLSDVDELDAGRKRLSIPESDWSTIDSASVDDAGENNPQLRRMTAEQIRIQSMGFDYVPDIPPPRPPTAPTDGTAAGEGTRMSFNPLNRLSQFTDMLVLNAEMYIKEHVPRPPRIFIERVLSQEERDKTAAPPSAKDMANDIIRNSYASQMTNPRMETASGPDVLARQTSAPARSQASPGPSREPGGSSSFRASSSPADKTGEGADELDFFLPARRTMIEGVEQDDFAGKFVSFFGWILFIYMRMMSLSVFCVFYPLEFAYLVGVHYGLMLLCLAIESRFKDKCQRILFYFCLAYIYIVVILEFKIKFRHVRPMYIGYFLLVLLENFIITFVWHATGEFYSWIYEYMFESCVVSGVLTLMCMIVYYLILRPSDVILFEDVEENKQKMDKVVDA